MIKSRKELYNALKKIDKYERDIEEGKGDIEYLKNLKSNLKKEIALYQEIKKGNLNNCLGLSIGQIILAYRIQEGLSVAAFAQKIEKPLTSVYYWDKHEYELMRVSDLEDILKFLGAEVNFSLLLRETKVTFKIS